MSNDDREMQSFEEMAREKPPSFVAQFFGFLRENKKWWLLPICATLLVIGLLLVLSTTAAAPFIYTLF
jgi:hypothetical protein